MALSSIYVLEKVRLEENEWRRYVIAAARTLWDTWGALPAWGKLHTSQWGQQILEFDALEKAAAEAQAQVEQRLKRGYKLVWEQ